MALVEGEVRERIEDAVDYVSLEVLVESRRHRGLPAPAADNASDRAEYDAGVRAFLERLHAELATDLTPEQRRRIEEAKARAGQEPVVGLVAVQVILARQLPDYWQRFEATRAAFTSEHIGSGGERRRLLDRLFRR
jgi:hypothetical protein